MMNVALPTNFSIKNVNSPFTELFSLLAHYIFCNDNNVRLASIVEERAVMRKHINNAVQVMLQGLQDVGSIMSSIDKEKMQNIPIDTIGNFISSISNMIEALNAFNQDIEYMNS